MGGESMGPPPGGEAPMGGGAEAPPPAPEGGGVTPENLNVKGLNILVEDRLFNSFDTLNFSKGGNSLIEIDDKLKSLLDK
jgi:hypothetical protein